MGKRIAPQCAFDNAIGPLHERHEKNDIDQRRVIGENQQAPPLEFFLALDVIPEHAHRAHGSDDAAKGKADQVSGHVRAPLASSNENVYERKNQDSANANGEKTQPGAKHAPIITDAT